MATLFGQLDTFHSNASHFNRTTTMHIQKPGAVYYKRRLPQEIFDHIIDHFHDQPSALRACALVSPPWLASARVHLFYRVTLDPPKLPQSVGFFFQRATLSSCQKLYDLIESRANCGSRLGSIAPFIRELHLHEGVLKREWFVQERALPNLLRALSNIRRLEISRAASVYITWQHLSMELKSALDDHILRLESLTELRLSSLLFNSLEDVTEVLRACGHLRTLEVDHVMFTDESVGVLDKEKDSCVSGHAGRMQLDMLVIGPRTSTAFMAFLLHPSSPTAVGTVRKLSMSISEDFAKFAKLLHASISVEWLELTLMNDVDLQEYWSLPPTDHLCLSQVPHLQNLKINIDILQKMEDPLPWLSALLSTGVNSTRQNAVKSIWVMYSLYLPAPYMDRSMNTAIFKKWSDIDAILCGVDTAEGEKGERGYGYEDLESVKLEFVLENPIGFGVAPRFLSELLLESPGLEGRNILRIHAFDTSR